MYIHLFKLSSFSILHLKSFDFSLGLTNLLKVRFQNLQIAFDHSCLIKVALLSSLDLIYSFSLLFCGCAMLLMK